jgi:hypothetical protein
VSPHASPAIECCPPSLSSQPLGAAGSKFLLSPHKPSLPLLSHHLAGSAVKKTDATSALFMTLIPKPCSAGSQGGVGEGEGRQALTFHGLTAAGSPLTVTLSCMVWAVCGPSVSLACGSAPILPGKPGGRSTQGGRAVEELSRATGFPLQMRQLGHLPKVTRLAHSTGFPSRSSILMGMQLKKRVCPPKLRPFPPLHTAQLCPQLHTCHSEAFSLQQVEVPGLKALTDIPCLLTPRWDDRGACSFLTPQSLQGRKLQRLPVVS